MDHFTALAYLRVQTCLIHFAMHSYCSGIFSNILKREVHNRTLILIYIYIYMDFNIVIMNIISGIE